MARRLLTFRWILTSLVVIAAVIIMFRLGIWQLERLDQRRAFNLRVSFQINAPKTPFNQLPMDSLPDLEFRKITLEGVFDYKQQFLLRNQPFEGQPGYHLVTPLKITGSSQAVLVDRGWIPLSNGSSELNRQVIQSELTVIRGVIRRSQQEPTVGGVPDPTFAPGQSRFEAWNFLDISRIQAQVPYTLLPVYIQEAPSPAENQTPVKRIEMPVLDEGPHLGYAMQWFAFAAILGIGYPFFVRHTLRYGKNR